MYGVNRFYFLLLTQICIFIGTGVFCIVLTGSNAVSLLGREKLNVLRKARVSYITVFLDLVICLHNLRLFSPSNLKSERVKCMYCQL